MKTALRFAIISAVLLLLFLVSRPLVGRLGEPTHPRDKGPSDLPVSERIPALDPTAIERGPAPSTDTPEPVVDVSAARDEPNLERLVLDYTNEERVKAGLEPVVPERDLVTTSREHNRDMMRRGFFAHVNPDGKGPSDRIAAHHRTLIGVTGENLWMSSHRNPADAETLAREIVVDWMNSPGHRANILRPDYTHLGVGVTRISGRIWATQNFAMVQGYLSRPLPERSRPGSSLVLDTRPRVATAAQATLYDLWSPGEGRAVTEPIPIGDAIPTVSPSAYILRLYFPDQSGTRFGVFLGPQIEIGSR